MEKNIFLNPVMWVPSDERIQSSQIFKFIKEINDFNKKSLPEEGIIKEVIIFIKNSLPEEGFMKELMIFIKKSLGYDSQPLDHRQRRLW